MSANDIIERLEELDRSVHLAHRIGWQRECHKAINDAVRTIREQRKEAAAPTAPAQAASEFDVRRILLAVVPGDGNGEEVYAKSVADVEAKLSEMGQRIEELESAQAASGGEVVVWRTLAAEWLRRKAEAARPAAAATGWANPAHALPHTLERLAMELDADQEQAPFGLEPWEATPASAPPAGDPPAPAAAREVVEALRSIIDDADHNLAAINTPRLVAAKEALARYDAAKTL